MRENNIYAKTKRKFKATTDSHHNSRLPKTWSIRTLPRATKPTLGFRHTYIPTDEGWLYLAAIEDLFNRKIVDWAMDKI